MALGAAAGLFSFVMVDLARNDAVFSAGFEVVTADPPGVVFRLSNTADKTMTDADISFALYDAEGAQIDTRDPGEGFGTADSHLFTPDLTIGPQAGKFGEIDATDISQPMDRISGVWVCAIFDGSFRVDRVRTEYTLRPRTGIRVFGQTSHHTDVYLFTTPDCTPPGTLVPEN